MLEEMTAVRREGVTVRLHIAVPEWQLDLCQREGGNNNWFVSVRRRE